MKATKLAFKGQWLPVWFSDHGFSVATIGIYHAMGVPFGFSFVAVGDNPGYLWSIKQNPWTFRSTVGDYFFIWKYAPLKAEKSEGECAFLQWT